MKKNVWTMVLLAGALCAAMPAMAESKEARAERVHEVRIGVGDAFADKAFNGPSYYDYGGMGRAVLRNAYFLPNLYAEYQYRINHWLGVGVQVNTQWMGWDRQYDGQWTTKQYGNFEVMPTIRFTYFHHEWVNLYSSVSLGYFGGIERRNDAYYYSSGLAFDFCALGVSIGKNRFFGTFEAGMLNAGSLASDNSQVLSRIMSFSVGYRF